MSDTFTRVAQLSIQIHKEGAGLNVILRRGLTSPDLVWLTIKGKKPIRMNEQIFHGGIDKVNVTVWGSKEAE